MHYTAAGLALAPSVRDAASRRGAALVAGDEDSAELIAEREAARQEAERRERHKVLVLNRLEEAAASVRRDYVTKLPARKTAPKGAATFVAHWLTRDPYILSQNHGSGLTAELLGVRDERAARAMVIDFSTNIGVRAQVISLAVVLGSLEARIDKSAWRNGTQRNHRVRVLHRLDRGFGCLRAVPRRHRLPAQRNRKGHRRATNRR